MKANKFLTALFVYLFLTSCGTPAKPESYAESPQPTTKAEMIESTMESGVAEIDLGIIPLEALMNGTYSGIYEEPITLVEGKYEGEPYVEGFSDRPTVQYSEGSELYGDLNGDGVHDAVVFLVERGGGTALISYIAAVLNREGQPVDAGALRMDEVSIRSGSIESGTVLLEIITAGPGDGDCCQSYKARRIYALRDGKLVEESGEEGHLERVSTSDLNGTRWTMIELNRDKPALAEVDVTVNFEDGAITGSGGCNTFRSEFKLGEDNPFVITTGPVSSTKKACPDDVASQEAAFFDALEVVSQWGYYYGRLALYNVDDQGEPGRLLFSPSGDATD